MREFENQNVSSFKLGQDIVTAEDENLFNELVEAIYDQRVEFSLFWDVDFI